MIAHISIHAPALLKVEILSPTDIKVELVGLKDSFDCYIPDGPIAPALQQTIALTCAQVVTDAMMAKLAEALREREVDDTTLNQNKPASA